MHTNNRPMSLAEMGSTFAGAYWLLVSTQIQLDALMLDAAAALADDDHMRVAVVMDEAEQLAKRVKPFVGIYMAFFTPLNALAVT